MRAATVLLACLALPPAVLSLALPLGPSGAGAAWAQAAAQTTAPTRPPTASPGGRPPPAANTPPPGPSGPEARRVELNRLLDQLAQAPDATAALALESRIRRLWAEGASPSVVLLLRRGQRNLEAESAADAVEDFDAALTLQPDHAEAWLMRARALSVLGDNAAAAADLRQVLVLEPRHFGALLTLSGLQQQGGDLPAALRSLEAALALYPQMPGAEARLRDLRRKVHGEAT